MPLQFFNDIANKTHNDRLATSDGIVKTICREEVCPKRISILGKRSVPKEQLKIAWYFNAGKGLEKPSPAGTAE
jgi:hypothetical protein